MTLAQYYDLLNKHDWYYEFSDDPTVHINGLRSSRIVASGATLSDAHKKLYLAFENYHFSGEAFGTEREAKPKKPE